MPICWIATTTVVTMTAVTAEIATARRALDEIGAPTSRNIGAATNGTKTSNTAHSHTGRRLTSAGAVASRNSDHPHAAAPTRVSTKSRAGSNWLNGGSWSCTIEGWLRVLQESTDGNLRSSVGIAGLPQIDLWE